MIRLRPEAWVLIVVLALAPIVGGSVAADSQPADSAWLVSAITGGSWTPLGTRLLLGGALLAALAMALLRHRVLTVPSLPLGGTALVLVGLAAGSVVWSAYPWPSLQAGLGWAAFGAALFLPVLVLGRGQGVRTALWAVAGGAGLTAAKGVSEYAQMRASEPSYRIFADWNNPNGLAAMLALAVCVSVGLAATAQRTERLGALALAALQAVALALTQSKGGWLAAGCGLVAFAACAVAWRSPRAALFALVPVLAGGLFSLALSAGPAAKSAPGAFARISDAGSTGEQSAGYRVLLWKSALELAKESPQGTGVGTFQFESARPGLVQRTFHAHQTWLQVAAESGWAALFALVALAVLWCREVGRGALSLPPERNALRAGVVGAMVAAAAAGFTETTLVFAGLGLLQFAMMGLALQLSADGTEPQLTPLKVRRTLALLALLPLLPMALGAVVEAQKSSAQARLALGDVQGARASAGSAAATSLGLDGEASYLAALTERDPTARVGLLREASRTLPTPRVFRALARAEQEAGRSLAARTALEAALDRDPNNLAALDALRKSLAADGLNGEAKAAALRALAVEATPAFRVRAIPESVPLETYDARIFLATMATDPEGQTALLRQAVEGFLQYRRLTVPQIERFARADLTFLGEGLGDARAALERGRDAARRLRALYGSAGDSEGEAWADAAVAELAFD